MAQGAQGRRESSEGVAHPSGLVTFLFTDLEGSTVLWDEHPDEMEAALAEHDARLRDAVARHNGYVFTTAGDSFAVAFESATDAFTAALDAQLLLREPCGPITVKVRMGLHTGTASLREGDYFGSAVNRAARLMSAAHGGQIVLSGSTSALVRDTLPDGVELRDRGQHRLKDLREPEHIFELRHPDLGSGFPELRTLDAAASDLPVQPTELIGRKRELADVRQLLDEHRLVTLTGSGGSGKTRLALHAAAESLDDHPAGVRLVELAGLNDSAFVLDEVGQRVGAQPTPDEDGAASIARKIGRLRMLLVLDNCEHVVEAVADLVAPLLRACPELRVLATSQVVLGVAGEHRYRVPSLSVPKDAVVSSAAESDAVRLFVERARAVSDGFELDERNVAHVTSICRRLDGIPLAIELAAARVRVLSPAQISARLDERFRLLGGGSRDSAERQRTLRAAMDWSHDLLSDQEKALFRRESIFVGDFDLDAAERVGAAPPIDEFDVLDLEAMLVDKSFVTTEDRPGGVRYRLTESIRAYGRERLEESGELVETGARHADHYVVLAQQLYEQRRGGDMKGAIVGYERDEDNFRAALRFLLDHGDLAWAAEVVGGIGHLWYTTGAFREGIAWCSELFDRDLDLHDELHARVLHVYATLGSWIPTKGVEIVEREIEIRRRLSDPERLAAALNNLGNMLSDLGRPALAEGHLRESIELFHAAGESASLSFSSLGWDALIAGQFDQATALYQEALDEAVRHNGDYDAALARLYLAHCAFHDEHIESARTHLEAARDAFVALGVRPGVGYAAMVDALLHRSQGDAGRAKALLRESLDDPDAHWYQSTAYWLLLLVASATDDPHAAAQLIGASGRQFASSQESQPKWVTDELDAVRTRVEEQLDDRALAAEIAAGEALTREQAVELGRRLLDG
jgi:predicted ATPase/class 3 adenylate cyclase